MTKEAQQEEKKRLRRLMLEKRRSLTPVEITVKSQKIADYFLVWPGYQQSQTIMLYLAMPDEAQTDLLLSDALQQGKRVCVPLLGEKYGEMAAAEITTVDDLIVGKFGLKAPDPNKAKIIAPSEIDLVVVPAVVFDRQGNRIGMGAGYYDRFLAKVRPDSRLLGLAWACQVVDSVPSEEHDRQVQQLLTEDGFFVCGNVK